MPLWLGGLQKGKAASRNKVFLKFSKFWADDGKNITFVKERDAAFCLPFSKSGRLFSKKQVPSPKNGCVFVKIGWRFIANLFSLILFYFRIDFRSSLVFLFLSMKIYILSAEANLYSTRRLVEAATLRGHQAQVVNHTKCHVMMEQGKPQIIYQGAVLEKPDAIIPRIGASVTFFGTAVVRQFEILKVLTANSSQGILQSRDKLRTMQLLSRVGLAIPKTVFAKFPKDKEVDDLIKRIGGTPVVIKLLEGTQGLGVMLAETPQAAKSTIEAFSGLKANILIQEFIKEAGGADIRAFVVGGEVVGAMRRQGKEGEFRSNLHRGGKSTVLELSQGEKMAAVGAARAVGLSVAGVDMLPSARGPLILEVNSSPGLEGIEGVTQKDIAGKIIEFLELSLKKSKSV
jgi:ribosomal protein S6--L-glutamate ligase